MPKSGNGTVFFRGGYWKIDVMLNGHRHRESSGSKKKSDAVKLLRKRLEEAASGTFIPDADKVLVSDILNMLVADNRVKGNRSRAKLKRICEEFDVIPAKAEDGSAPFTRAWWRAMDKVAAPFSAGWKARAITTDRARSYQAARLKEGAALGTVNQELAALRRAFKIAVEADRLPKAPVIKTPTPKNARTGFFTTDELARVLAELPEAVEPVVRFAALTGWRKQEVLDLLWVNVDWDAGEVRLETSKNGEGRVFPFRVLPPLKALLIEQRERTRALERETGGIIKPVFHRHRRKLDGKVAWVRPIRSIQVDWDNACERAGVDMLFHDLRRTAVRNLERAGVPRSVAMSFTGHKTEAVYRRYAIVDKSAQEEGVAKLAKLYATESEKAPRKVVSINERAG
jgi:integrase